MNLIVEAAFLVVNAASAVAIVGAVIRRRPVRREAWLALAVAMGLYFVADVMHLVANLAAVPAFDPIGEGLYALGYPLFFFAAIRFATGARRLDPVVFIDAAIIAIGLGLLVWISLFDPTVRMEGSALALAIAYPVVGGVLVALVLPLSLMRQTRSASAMLVLAGFAMVCLSDTRFAMRFAGGAVQADGLSNLGWLTGYLLLGVAALVPSAARLGALHAPRTAKRDEVRFVALSVALLIPPALILVELNEGRSDDVAPFALLAIALGVLVILRLHRTVAEFVTTDQRFARFMSHDGIMAAIKDGAGRYLYMNPTAERLAGVGTGQGWYGRTDLELAPAEEAHRRRRLDDDVRRTRETLVTTQNRGSQRWVLSEFPMPGNHGSVGVLAIDLSDVARAEEELRAAVRVSERRAQERALIAETLAALDVGRTPEETATAICDRVLGLPDTSIASVVTFSPGGIATILGQSATVGTPVPGRRYTAARSAYLRQRAASGPWVGRWVANPEHPASELLVSLGVQAHAFAPLLYAGQVQGVLIVGSAARDAVATLTERLPAIAEFGQITGALLGPQLAGRLATAQTEATIRDVIDREAFDIAFQAIVALDSGETPGYEALARFHDGVDPDAHFRRAREAGLAVALELACLRRALADSERLEPGAWLNVNVSAELVLSDALTAILPLEDRIVVLEITEHDAVTDYHAFRAAVARLDGRVKVCVDDAGAGYASLRHIVELGPRFVKLDRSLVAGIGSDAARQAVVAGMVHFAETAGLTLIAEGIETPEELAFIREAKVPLGQGYLLGRPAFLTTGERAEAA